MRSRHAGIAVVLSLLATVATSRAQTPSPGKDRDQDYSVITAAKGKVPDPERLRRLIVIYLNEPPLGAPQVTAVAGHRAIWVPRTEVRFSAERAQSAARLEAVRSIDQTGLDAQAKADWQVLQSIAASEAELAAFPMEYAWPELADEDLWFRIDSLPRQSVDDYRDIVAWLRGVPMAVAESRDLLRAGRGAGRHCAASRNAGPDRRPAQPRS